MRFLHTSDWHLGRLFHGVHLTSDQAHVLDQFVDLVAQTEVDAVVIAGDLYDRAVPPDDAVALLDDVLARIVLDHGVPVIAIAGNHDSPRRVGFAARLLGGSRLHLVGPTATVPATVVLEDAHGPVAFHPLPFADPADVRSSLGAPDVRTHDDALRALVARCERAPETRHVAIAHAFVVGGDASDSERPLAVGGSDQVAVDVFDGFHYTALGHLHRPQRAGGRDHVRYSGSLLKYSFSEATHEKGVLLVELDAAGHAHVETHALTPRHDVRVVEGTFADLLEGPAAGEDADDYLLVRLTDAGTIVDAMARLQAVYPNAVALERPGLAGAMAASSAPVDHRKRSDQDLFTSFVEHATGTPLDDEAETVLVDVLDDLRRAREERA